MNSRAHLIIHGQVQGVGFRNFVRRSARKFGVTGWVRNLSDGAVEVVAEGEKISVEEFVEACKRGPVFARVKGLELKWEGFEGKFDDFEIMH